MSTTNVKVRTYSWTAPGVRSRIIKDNEDACGNNADTIVVADGVGSCAEADMGSTMVVDMVLGTTAISGESLDMEKLPKLVVSRWEERLRKNEVNPNEAHTTLRFTKVTPEGFALTATVGDGATFFFLKDGSVLQYNVEGVEDPATHVLSHTNHWKGISHRAVDLEAVVHTTDGIQKMIDASEWARFFKEVVGHYKRREYAELLSYKKWLKKEGTDDKSFAIMIFD